MLLPFQGATAPTRETQGVATLALGWVLHWAFSPHLQIPICYIIVSYKTVHCGLVRGFHHEDANNHFDLTSTG